MTVTCALNKMHDDAQDERNKDSWMEIYNINARLSFAGKMKINYTAMDEDYYSSTHHLSLSLTIWLNLN